jgi:hypothetical protein
MNWLTKIKGLFGKKTKQENSNTISSSNINKILEEYRVLDRKRAEVISRLSRNWNYEDHEELKNIEEKLQTLFESLPPRKG